MNEDKWTYKAKNYKKLLLSLEEAKEQYVASSENKVIRACLIKNFEFCIELACRVMRTFHGKWQQFHQFYDWIQTQN